MAICEHCAVTIEVVPPKRIAFHLRPEGVRDSSSSYTGEYEFTPNDDTQVVEIAGLKATQDIIINPVPSNYGHIAWNGAYLTVY